MKDNTKNSSCVEPNQLFRDMCDELVLSKNKMDMIEQIKWIEEEAKKRGITTYEFIFLILNKYDVDEKARKWRKSKVVEGSS